MHAMNGNTELAVIVAKEAMRLAPSDPAAGEQLASVYADAGDAEHLAPLADFLVSRFPQRDNSRYYQANALFLNGRIKEALEEARTIVARNPNDARAENLLGVACATSGLHDCALTAFRAALAANPRDPTTYVNLGVLHMQSPDPAAAAQYFSVALTLDPATK